MQTHLEKQSTPTAQYNVCRKCGSELRVHWCERCFGTGKSGMHKCKKCGGTGRRILCQNVHSHKLDLFGWIFRKAGAALRENEETKGVH